MKLKLTSPYGKVSLQLDKEVVTIKADTDLAAFWGQGYATAKLRLWQLDLSRRVAGGQLCEILGKKARRTDVFQRKLGLRELASREVLRCQQVASQTGKEELQSLQVKAYVAGINQALQATKIWPFECVILQYKPQPFTEEDVYAIAQLKYFINSAWQYELFHTHVLKRLNANQAGQLFTTFTEEGQHLPPLAYESPRERSLFAEKALQEGLEGLRLMGLSSPDTGSNVFAISAARSATGAPLLASDPHMGQVNPSFSLLCQLTSSEGLKVFGANFPGIPGIVVGRNDSAAWGMVGIMADNQDLSYAEIDWQHNLVKENGQWLPLQKIEQPLVIKGEPTATITTYAYERGRLIQKNDNYGIFLRWPALDAPLGDITFYKLAKCHDWRSFKDSLRTIHNAPMMVGYADIHGDIGLHAVGLLPNRKVVKGAEHLGCILQNQDNPASVWEGYLAFDKLPCVYNPPEGYVIYANQYSQALFADKSPLSNRWHPPTRALRIKELITAKDKLTVADITAIQDDKIDLFARQELPFLLALLNQPTPLTHWQGDTRRVDLSLLFERWLYALAYQLCANKLGSRVFALYTDFWPSFRWCIMDILRHHLADWLSNEQLADFSQNPQAFRASIVNKAYQQANVAVALPTIALQHSIKQPAWLSWLLTGRGPYLGGNRETIHATRQNTDFLTASQTNFKDKKQKPFSFGPAFKFVSNLDEAADITYAINSPAKGRPFFWSLASNLHKWQYAERYRLALNR